MHILVTGCGGYIGSLLTQKLLHRGHKVTGIDNFYYGNYRSILGSLGHNNFTFHYGDAADRSMVLPLLKNVDVVIPLAAYVGMPICKKLSNVEVARVNCDAIRLISSSLSNGQKLIYPNTNSGYGQKEGFCVETDELKPISVYGETKTLGEKYVLERDNSVVFRLATVFGTSPRMRLDLMLNDWTSQLCKLRKLEVYEGHFRRNFIHIRDVCRAFIWFIEHNLTGVYNVGNSYLNITKMGLARFIGYTLRLPTDCITHGDGKDEDQRDYLVSNTKLESTGFSCANGFDKGILEVAQFCNMIPEDEISSKDLRNI